MTAETEEVQLVPCEPGQLTPAELRTLFLFEKLTDEQLEWISAHGCTMHMPAGGVVIREGDPAEQFFMLLSGTISLTRKVGQDDIETTRTEQRGVYMGATQAYLRDDGVPRNYMASMRALDDSDFFVLSAADFSHMMREWFPMALHLLEGLALGMRNTAAAIGERQRLAALGALSAGLMHELNNPAAAASRAAESLRQRVAGMLMVQPCCEIQVSWSSVSFSNRNRVRSSVGVSAPGSHGTRVGASSVITAPPGNDGTA